MTGQLTTKVRLVRCPRCRGVLQEHANIPVYQCAGCGTILQAKKRKNDSKDAELHMHETQTAKKDELEHVSNDKETRSQSQEEPLPSTGEQPLDKNCGSDQDEIKDSTMVHSGEIKFSSDLSTELPHHGNEESSSAIRAETEVDQEQYIFEQNNGGDQNEHGYCNGKQPGGLSFSDEVVSSTELNHHESEESSPIARAQSDVDVEQNNGMNQPGNVSFSHEVASSTELNHHKSEESSLLAGVHSEVDENRNCLEQNNGRNQSEFGDYKRKWPGNIKFPNELSSSNELACQEIAESCPVVGTSTEVDENFKSRLIFGSSSVENLLAVSPRDSIIAPQWPLGDQSILTDNHMSPHSEQLEQSQKGIPNVFDRVSSIDPLKNIARANPSSEFNVTLREMPKSPTTRSYYAYYDSASSCDGTDDQVPDLHPHLSRRKFKEADSTKAMPRREGVMDNITSCYPEMQHQAWNCPSILSEKKHDAMKGSKWCQDELLESTRHGHPVRSRMKFETGEHLSRLPFYSRDCQGVYEKGSPSNYGRKEFQYSTSSHSPNKPEYLEEEKMELLKMVYKLQDQLNRTNERFPRVTGTEKQIPSYCDHVAPEVKISHELSSTRHAGRCDQARSWPHRSRISQIPFSAEATISGYQFDQSCLHSCPQDWKCSAPLPPHICCYRSQNTAHPPERCYNLYCCSPLSPQHYQGSEFSLQSCDAKSDDHWNTNHDEVKKFSRERRHLVKRHVRPVASGAPFLVCYGCLKLLQLPADFLLFRRRCHKLRCSACSVVLKFSLQNGTHIVPYTDVIPDAIAPPPSEVDDCSEANNRKKLASVSYANNCSHADPVSCSDDYGPSLCKSCSTEGEPDSVTLPFQALKRDSNGRNMSSGSSFEPMEERKKRPIFKESQKENKIPVKTFASSGSSSTMSKAEKFSSEIEELPPITGSPLHKLMGYSSPHAVMDS